MRTPSGRIAEIIFTYPEEREALVRWPDGEVATFRMSALRSEPSA